MQDVIETVWDLRTKKIGVRARKWRIDGLESIGNCVSATALSLLIFWIGCGTSAE